MNGFLSATWVKDFEESVELHYVLAAPFWLCQRALLIITRSWKKVSCSFHGFKQSLSFSDCIGHVFDHRWMREGGTLSQNCKVIIK